MFLVLLFCWFSRVRSGRAATSSGARASCSLSIPVQSSLHNLLPSWVYSSSCSVPVCISQLLLTCFRCWSRNFLFRSRDFRGAVFVQILCAVVTEEKRWMPLLRKECRVSLLLLPRCSWKALSTRACSNHPLEHPFPATPSLHQLRHSLWCDCCSVEMSVSLERQTQDS